MTVEELDHAIKIAEEEIEKSYTELLRNSESIRNWRRFKSEKEQEKREQLHDSLATAETIGGEAANRKTLLTNKSRCK